MRKKIKNLFVTTAMTAIMAVSLPATVASAETYGDTTVKLETLWVGDEVTGATTLTKGKTATAATVCTECHTMCISSNYEKAVNVCGAWLVGEHTDHATSLYATDDVEKINALISQGEGSEVFTVVNKKGESFEVPKSVIIENTLKSVTTFVTAIITVLYWIGAIFG